MNDRRARTAVTVVSALILLVSVDRGLFRYAALAGNRKTSALQFFHFSAVWQAHRKYLSPENKPDNLRGTCLCVPVMFVFASELSPPGVSQCHTESQAG